MNVDRTWTAAGIPAIGNKREQFERLIADMHWQNPSGAELCVDSGAILASLFKIAQERFGWGGNNIEMIGALHSGTDETTWRHLIGLSIRTDDYIVRLYFIDTGDPDGKDLTCICIDAILFAENPDLKGRPTMIPKATTPEDIIKKYSDKAMFIDDEGNLKPISELPAELASAIGIKQDATAGKQDVHIPRKRF